MKHEDQEYAMIFENCVKEMQIRRERVLREFLNSRSEMVVMAVMIRVSLFIFLANNTVNHFSHSLIMISELLSNLQKSKMSSHGHNALVHLHAKFLIHSKATNGHDLKII